MPNLSTMSGYIDTALSGITGIKYSTTDIGRYNESNDYPGVYYVINEGSGEYFAFPHSSNPDMIKTLEVVVEGTVKPRYTKNIQADTRSFMAKVEKAFNGSANIQNNSFNVIPKSEENDLDTRDGYGFFRMTFEIDFFYNHLDP